MDFYKEQGYTLLNLRQAGSRGRMSEESRKRMSESGIKGKQSAEVRKKMSLLARGRKHSPETKQKMSKSRRGANHSNFKGFILAYKDHNLIGRFAGCKEAAQQLGISPWSVCRSINEHRRLPRIGYEFIREILTTTST